MSRRDDSRYIARVIWLAGFGVAMGFLEAAVVIYLREISYPGGFAFPLKVFPQNLAMIELGREAATLLMLVAVAALAARRFWERFGYFIYLFGIWDIFYYFWLKIAINWPRSISDSDILFLIPAPWIGPVLAPVLLSVLMVVSGFLITRLYHRGIQFRPGPVGWVVGLVGTAAILYSFMNDTEAAGGAGMPRPYPYWWLIFGLVLYLLGLWAARKRSTGKGI